MKQLMQLSSSLLILVMMKGICIEGSAVYKDLLHSVKETTRDVKCDEGWEEFSGHCYYLPDEHKDWTSARYMFECVKSACETMGFDSGSIMSSCIVERMTANLRKVFLVRIESWDENDWIRRRMKTGMSWVGGIRAFHVDFVWYNNRDDLIFTNYNRGEPNNYSGDENCLEISSDNHGTWNDLNCGFFLSFICDKD